MTQDAIALDELGELIGSASSDGDRPRRSFVEFVQHALGEPVVTVLSDLKWVAGARPGEGCLTGRVVALTERLVGFFDVASIPPANGPDSDTGHIDVEVLARSTITRLSVATPGWKSQLPYKAGMLPPESSVTVHFAAGVHEPLEVSSRFSTQSAFYSEVRRGLTK